MRQKILVIGPYEFRSGFMLAGVDYMDVDDPTKLKKLIRQIYESKEYGLVIIEDSYEKHLDNRTRSIIYESVNPLFFLMDFDRRKGKSVEEQLKEIVRRAIGVEMNIKE